jgi:hypothetical protein
VFHARQKGANTGKVCHSLCHFAFVLPFRREVKGLLNNIETWLLNDGPREGWRQVPRNGLPAIRLPLSGGAMRSTANSPANPAAAGLDTPKLNINLIEISEGSVYYRLLFFSLAMSLNKQNRWENGIKKKDRKRCTLRILKIK